MANARKCDRCGKCFDPLTFRLTPMARFQNPIFQTGKDISENKVGSRLVEGVPDASYTYIDLCPDCSDSFRLFMNNYPLAVEKGYFDRGDLGGDTDGDKETIKMPPEERKIEIDAHKSTKDTDEDKEYQKTAFQKFLDKIDTLGDEFFNDLGKDYDGDDGLPYNLFHK